jgi:hypothetical protein
MNPSLGIDRDQGGSTTTGGSLALNHLREVILSTLLNMTHATLNL